MLAHARLSIDPACRQRGWIAQRRQIGAPRSVMRDAGDPGGAFWTWVPPAVARTQRRTKPLCAPHAETGSLTARNSRGDEAPCCRLGAGAIALDAPYSACRTSGSGLYAGWPASLRHGSGGMQARTWRPRSPAVMRVSSLGNGRGDPGAAATSQLLRLRKAQAWRERRNADVASVP